jgi:hypothetical protein
MLETQAGLKEATEHHSGEYPLERRAEHDYDNGGSTSGDIQRTETSRGREQTGRNQHTGFVVPAAQPAQGH